MLGPLFTQRQCVACEEHGAFRLWRGSVATMLCPKHDVELSECIAVTPEFHAVEVVELAWQEYLQRLACGGMPDAARAKRILLAKAALARVIRKRVKQLAAGKRGLEAKQRAEEKRLAKRRPRKARKDT